MEIGDSDALGDLLDDFEGIGDATAPKGIPEGVNLTADVSSDHARRAIAARLFRDKELGKRLTQLRLGGRIQIS